jgi:hypothetical protein
LAKPMLNLNSHGNDSQYWQASCLHRIALMPSRM